MLMPTPPAHAPAGSAAVPAPIARLLQRAGIQVDGPAPWDLQLHDAISPEQRAKQFGYSTLARALRAGAPSR